MGKYIDAEKLLGEIEQLNSLVPYENKDRHDDGLHDAYKAVKNVIDSLRQEQPDVTVNIGKIDKSQEEAFEKEYSKFSNEPDAGDYALPIDISDYKDFARHFYELGKKSKEPVIEDLEVRERIEELANDWHHKGFASGEDCPLCMQDLMDILWHFYELGIKTKKEK